MTERLQGADNGLAEHTYETLYGWQVSSYSVEPGFRGQYHASQGGEHISLTSDMHDAGLLVEVLGSDGKVEQSHVLTRQGDNLCYFGRAATLRFATSDEPASFTRVF